MQYPEVLLPLTHFKKIEKILTGHYICRTVADRNLLAKDAFDSSILSDNPAEFFDYSTNLPGRFLLEFNYISLIGERKKYFRDYWDFSGKVEVPIFNEDFTLDGSKGYFFLPINLIHQRIKIPFRKPPKEIENSVTAVVVHTPTRSNFWHFSIRWLDSEGTFIKSSNSTWKNQITASMRAALLELVELDTPQITDLEESVFQ